MQTASHCWSHVSHTSPRTERSVIIDRCVQHQQPYIRIQASHDVRAQPANVVRPYTASHPHDHPQYLPISIFTFRSHTCSVLIIMSPPSADRCVGGMFCCCRSFLFLLFSTRNLAGPSADCLAGVKAGRVNLCRVAGNTV